MMTTNQITNDTTHAAPELRFPEFHDDWQVKRLGEIAEIVSEKENNSIDNYVSTENLLPNYGGVIFDAKISSINSITKYKLGDILLSNIRPYLKKIWQANVNGTASNDVIVFRVSNTFDDSFICFVLKNDRFIDYVMASAKGVKMPRGDKNMMLNYAVSFPTLAEQRKIALCLSSLDDLIKSVGDKIELLKQHKKGLMQKLFPSGDGMANRTNNGTPNGTSNGMDNGTSNGRDAINRVSTTATTTANAVPELRFPEFSGDWQMKTLGEICKSELGKTRDEGRNTGTLRPYLCAINVLWGRIDLTNIKQMPFEDFELERYLVRKGDFLVCEGGEIGRCAIYDNDLEVYYQNALHRIRFYEGYDSFFIMHLLCYYHNLGIIERFGKGSTIKHLNQSQLKTIPIYFPTLAEQRKIAECLSSLDAEIQKYEQKLQMLEQHKKGLMQKMFVRRL